MYIQEFAGEMTYHDERFSTNGDLFTSIVNMCVIQP